MRRTTLLVTLCASLGGAGGSMAQAPGAPGASGAAMAGAAMGPDPAAMLLARTGDLQLTDAQVVRLAAISRRSADRRRTLRASFDSIRPPMTAGARPDSATREALRARFAGMRTRMEQMRAAQHTDLRDAIAVLTADQQARAWEMVAARREGMRMRRGEFGRGMMRRFGPGGPDGPGARGGVMMRRREPGDGAPGAPRRPPSDDWTGKR